MLKTKKLAPGVTRSLPAIALIAATFLAGGLTEASAKSRKHHHHHVAKSTEKSTENSAEKSTKSDWRDANAAMTPTAGAGHSFVGVASFYGNESGSQTASGQRFNQNALTCAHRSLPFGTKLKVTHNGKSVVVTVNDRGPFIKGRVLDLSTTAARAVGLTDSGVGHVTAEVI